MEKKRKKSTVRDMTDGPILMHMIMFSLPLILGNIFQLLYNTVDTWVVGNFVSTQALAAVGSTTMLVNLFVFCFNGLSIGATVIIGHDFGARDLKKLHVSIETTMALTFILSIVFTILGVALVRPMLVMMSTPEDVLPEATVYLRIYLGGISGLLVYNMGSGILRAVGDTTRPLMFLIFTSVLNIILDLAFVLVFGLGIAGVALATILSQFISAFFVLYLLIRTNDIYKLTLKDLAIDVPTMKKILAVGLPTAVQSMLTSFSNMFVQAYINVFGSACMAGWSCYNKLDQFAFLSIQSLSSAATTFVSQNLGAKREDRAQRGTRDSVLLAVGTTLAIAIILVTFAEPATRFFTSDESVIYYGVLFIRMNTFFLLCNSVNHVLAGALRGRGDSRGPMLVMLATFVVCRQIYLFLITHLVADTPQTVGFGYPVGWMLCCMTELGYYWMRYGRKHKKEIQVRTEA